MCNESRTHEGEGSINNKTNHLHAQVLLIDDQRTIIKGIELLLAHAFDINLHTCSDPGQALKIAKHIGPTVVLLDIQMPDIDGFAVLEQFRADPSICDVPVIMLSANEDPETKAKAFTLGADDYLIKAPEKIELIARIRYHSKAYINNLERQSAYQELEENRIKLEAAVFELERLSTLDGLTKIYNRRHFDTIILREWGRAKRESTPISLIMIDIDHFKQYNDHYGHLEGDSCLIQVAQTLTNTLKRSTDHVARYGGEEFIVTLPSTNTKEAAHVAERLRQSIADLALQHANSETDDIVTISLGVSSCVPEGSEKHESLISSADQALYQAKEQGRNRVVTLSKADKATSSEHDVLPGS